MSASQPTHIGFVYHFDHYSPEGILLDSWDSENLMPYEGMNYILNAALKGGSATANWYVSLFTASGYTPALADTLAGTLATMVETSAIGASRVAITATVTNGAYSNSASPASFTFTTGATIYGAFACSNATVGASAGTLLSADKFGSSKTMATGEILQVTAGITFSN